MCEWLSIVALIAGVSSGSETAACQRLRPSIPVVSFENREAMLFREIVETVDEQSRFEIDPEEVGQIFEHCLTRANEHQSRSWIGQVESPGGLGRSPLWKVARRTTERALRSIPEADRDEAEQLLWHAWIEALIESLRQRNNYYTYADELDIAIGEARGRVFSVGFELQREGDLFLTGEILEDDLETLGLAPGATLQSLDGRAPSEIDSRELIRYWYSTEPFTYAATFIADGVRIDVARPAVTVRMRTVISDRLDDIGYLRIRRFATETLIELRRELRELRDTDALVIDLRGNPGGKLSAGVIDAFLKPSQTLYSSREIGVDDDIQHRKGSVEYNGQTLAVLIDRSSASMSEMFAAAVRANERGILVGETTSGKGVSQSVFSIGEEGSLALVRTEFYFPDTEESWHENGIDPHVPVALDEETRTAVDRWVESSLVDLREQLEMDPVLAEAWNRLEAP